MKVWMNVIYVYLLININLDQTLPCVFQIIDEFNFMFSFLSFS